MGHNRKVAKALLVLAKEGRKVEFIGGRNYLIDGRKISNDQLRAYALRHMTERY